MSVTRKDELMAVGSWEVDLDFTPVVKALLVDDDNYNRPRKLHALIYDAAVGGTLLYPPLPLLRASGDEEGITIGGVGPLWHLGAEDIGPIITDREYVSGFDKLSNGPFDLDDLYWRRASEDSQWVVNGGSATNVGTLTVDDVLESDEKFPTRPGYAYLLRVTGLTATGIFRTRILFEGRFNPANLVVGGDFETAPLTYWTVGPSIALTTTQQRHGTTALAFSTIAKPQLISNSGFESGAADWPLGPTMTVSAAGLYAGTLGLIAAPNPKPQLISNSDFAAGATDWLLGSTFAVSGGALVAAANPKPQYIADPNFNNGAGGWVGTGQNIGNISIVNEPSQGFGGWTMKAGPVNQHQVFLNADFGNGLTNWYQSSTDAEPHVVWETDSDGMDGNPCARTTGWSTAGRTGPELIKYLRADRVDGTGADAYTVAPGEVYEAEAYFRGAPGTEGQAYIALMIPHPSVPAGDRWYLSKELEAPPMDDMRWQRVTINNVTIPANRTLINGLVEVHNHGLGYWYVDRFTLTRTRGNRARIVSTTAYAVSAGTEYRFSADIRSGGAQQEGSVRLGVVLTGAGKTDIEVAVDKGSTDYEWNRESVDVRPPDGYTSATPFVSAQDILGDPVWLDLFTFEKVSNNTDTTTHSAVAVIPGQRYTLSADVTHTAVEGSITIGVTLTGSGLPNQVVEMTQSVGGAADAKHMTQEVRPDTGYTLATPFVRSKDIEGGTFTIDNVRLHKADNNTDESTHSSFALIADQRYLLSAVVRSAASATNGSVTVGLRLTGGGLPTQSIDVSHDLTAGEWKGISQEVRAPAGYTTATPFIGTKDIEGGNFSVDNVTLEQSDNNSVRTTHTNFAVIPERTYRYTAAVKAGTGLKRGSIRLGVTCVRLDGAEQVFESPSMEDTAGEWKLHPFEFTPPSGYYGIYPYIRAIDVEGAFYVDDVEIRDTDSATMAFDTWTLNPAGSLDLPATAPDGAEWIRAMLVLPEDGANSTVAGASLARTGVTPATAAAVVADLLEDPLTGDPLSVTAGTITAPAVIPYDWVLQNMTNRAALDHLCSVVADPPLVYRVLPTLPATIDVGPAATVFDVHDPADALLPEDIDVEDLSDPEVDVETRATVIRVIGAERQTVSGRPILITADAQVPGTVELDYNGRPIVRTKIVSDATVDHFGYAQALADDLAAREAEPALALSVKLSGKATRADSPPGDTVYVYHPESGLEDSANATTIEGQTVFPRAVQVLASERSHGPSHRIEMRASDGTTFVLPGVLWSDEDATVLTVGDRLPDWSSDPQGTATGVQYLRDRASRPR